MRRVIIVSLALLLANVLQAAPAAVAPANDAPAAVAQNAPANAAPANDAPAAVAQNAPANDAPAAVAPANDAPANDAPAAVAQNSVRKLLRAPLLAWRQRRVCRRVELKVNWWWLASRGAFRLRRR